MKPLSAFLSILFFSSLIFSCDSDDEQLIRPLNQCMEPNMQEVAEEFCCLPRIDSSVADINIITGPLPFSGQQYDFAFYNCEDINSLVFTDEDGTEMIYSIQDHRRFYGYRRDIFNLRPGGVETTFQVCYQPDLYQVTIVDSRTNLHIIYSLQAVKIPISGDTISDISGIRFDSIFDPFTRQGSNIVFHHDENLEESRFFQGNIEINEKKFRDVLKASIPQIEWLSEVYFNTTYGIVGLETEEGKLWALERME